jgi:hypothetical protein
MVDNEGEETDSIGEQNDPLFWTFRHNFVS